MSGKVSAEIRTVSEEQESRLEYFTDCARVRQ
jgi:hypothetical protein